MGQNNIINYILENYKEIELDMNNNTKKNSKLEEVGKLNEIKSNF